MAEEQPELFVTTGRLSANPKLLKEELHSARRLVSGAAIRLRRMEAALLDARERGTRSQVIRAECDVANVHRTLDGLEVEIKELEEELMGEWAPVKGESP